GLQSHWVGEWRPGKSQGSPAHLSRRTVCFRLNPRSLCLGNGRAAQGGHYGCTSRQSDLAARPDPWCRSLRICWWASTTVPIHSGRASLEDVVLGAIVGIAVIVIFWRLRLTFLPMPTVANFDEQKRTTVKVVLLQVGALA